jgi:hypothetical protein
MDTIKALRGDEQTIHQSGSDLAAWYRPTVVAAAAAVTRTHIPNSIYYKLVCKLIIQLCFTSLLLHIELLLYNGQNYSLLLSC